MLLYFLAGVIAFQLVIICWLLSVSRRIPEIEGAKADNTPDSVATFYNSNTDKFLAVYGEIIQAFRTKNVSDYLEYTLRSIELSAQMKVLDAGCGVCGPACYFAKAMPGLRIEAVTISDIQCHLSNEKISEQSLNEFITARKADFHQLSEIFPPESFDRIYFLESFGHSHDKPKAIHQALDLLKVGGKLYIKDLFLRESNDPWETERINILATQINTAYQYSIADLNEIISCLRREGFIIQFVRVPQVERDKFENLTISNDFQNLFNIGKIESWDDYIFPIDFYEILVEKPPQVKIEDLHLYYMNLKSQEQ